MNTRVQIDDDQVRTELEQIEQEQRLEQPLPPDAAPPGPPLAPAPAALPPDWSAAAAGVVVIFDRVIAPNWNLELEERRALHEATTAVLAAFFPDALDPRVQASLALAGTMFAIAQARFDPATNKVRPMRLKKPAPKSAPADDTANRAAA